MVVIDQPDAAAVAFGLFHQRLCEHSKEALDIGLPHQRIERELDDLRLHPGAALRASAFVGLANQRGAKDLRIVRGDFCRPLMCFATRLAASV
jgi:hypothetical protein